MNPMSASFRTRAKNLKEYPTWYLRGMSSKHKHISRRWAGEHCQKMMDWASWELARSILDESIKNSVGILIYLNTVNNLYQDSIRDKISTFNPNFISTFAVSSLYFSHLHATMAGLSLGGIIMRDGRFIARDNTTIPRWKSIDESWEVDWKRPSSHIHHIRIFEQYDSVRRHQVTWLPGRSKELKSLKNIREAITYHTERLGGWDQRKAIETIETTFPFHIKFQESLIEPLCEFVEGKVWNRSYSPTRRTVELKKRFDEYKELASFCLE